MSLDGMKETIGGFKFLDAQETKTSMESGNLHKFLTRLVIDSEVVDQLQWEMSLSEDEKETIFSAEKDGFEIKISARNKTELLDISLICYEASISLKEQLVGPIVVNGDKVKELFERLEAKHKGEE